MSIFVGILHFQPGMTPQDILNAAKQGNPQAIAALMNRSLQPKGITARARLVDGTLQVMLEGDTAPSQAESVAYVTKGIKGLEIPGISNLMIAGKAIGAENLEWTERIELIPQQQAIQAPKISTIQKKENPQSMPGRPASGLKYQAPSIARQQSKNNLLQKILKKLQELWLLLQTWIAETNEQKRQMEEVFTREKQAFNKDLEFIRQNINTVKQDSLLEARVVANLTKEVKILGGKVIFFSKLTEQEKYSTLLLLLTIFSDNSQLQEFSFAQIKKGYFASAKAYALALEVLEKNPKQPKAKQFVLNIGRWHFGKLRKGKVTIYDEQAIQNDIQVRIT
jgi:hypothetical protein